jgi:membrane complex biogenesis BtpA family protein
MAGLLAELFRAPRPIVGVVHLQPLPGAPRAAGPLEAVLERARTDARALAEGGCDGLIVENFGDAPFLPGPVGPETVAALAVAARELASLGLPLGVNVLRNDARAALGIAAVTGARFIRVNVHTGVMATDQGLIEGRAHETLRLRRALGADVKVFADVQVKHAAPVGPRDVAQAVRDAVHRGLADAVIVTGPGTGQAVDLAELRAARAAAGPGTPLFAGSGVTAATAREVLALADGAIVGTAFERDGVSGNPVDVARVRALVQAAKRT